MRELNTFSGGICPRMSVIAWLESELAYFLVTVHQFSWYATVTASVSILKCYLWFTLLLTYNVVYYIYIYIYIYTYIYIYMWYSDDLIYKHIKHMLYSDDLIYKHIIHIHLHMHAEHNDTRKTSDTDLRKIYLSLYSKVLCVRGSWRPNRTATYWPPLLWP